MIEGAEPADWRALQHSAAAILSESGLTASVDHEIPLARGTVRVDVYARDPSTKPETHLICECKLWQSPVSKDIVHAFRTVVTDAGVHRGFLISTKGFQAGAVQAAEFSNLTLLTWSEFQALFAERWFKNYMSRRLNDAIGPFLEYTEPVNSRIDGRAKALGAEQYARFLQLQNRHVLPTAVALGYLHGRELYPLADRLPLRRSLKRELHSMLPDALLDAPALRPLMEATIDMCTAATAEFDEAFGGTRA